MLAIYKRELKSYLTSMVGYLFIFFVLVLTGIYFSAYQLSGGYSKFETTLSALTFVFLIAVPILTMRVLAEERKQKTDQLLFTAPVRLTGIVLGKFFAALVVFAIGILITLVYVVVISSWGQLEAATVIGNYVAILATAMAFISIGVFISSLTQNQLVACVATVAVFLGLYLMDYSYSFMKATWAKNLIYYFSMFRRYEDFAQGIFSFADLFFYLSVAGTFVFLTVRMLERKRWS